MMNTKPTNPKDICGIRKAPMSTVSAAVLAEIGVAMLEGGAKYGRHNYRAVGVRASVYYDATMRHLMAWWEGEDIDPDSGMSHITKAITSLVVLRDAMIQSKVEDDRAPSSAEFYQRLNKLAGEILDRHADKSPRHYTIADSKAMAEHAAREDDARPVAECNALADGWVEWRGGECPVGDNYKVEYTVLGMPYILYGRAQELLWENKLQGQGIITSYRVVSRE